MVTPHAVDCNRPPPKSNATSMPVKFHLHHLRLSTTRLTSLAGLHQEASGTTNRFQLLPVWMLQPNTALYCQPAGGTLLAELQGGAAVTHLVGRSLQGKTYLCSCVNGSVTKFTSSKRSLLGRCPVSMISYTTSCSECSTALTH